MNRAIVTLSKKFHNVVGEIVIVFFPLETAIHIEKQQESRFSVYILHFEESHVHTTFVFI